MKNKYFSLLILLCVSYTLRAQTTDEEYNYVTKGLKIQMESGLDMKKGYEIVSVDTIYYEFSNQNNYQTNSGTAYVLQKLVRTNISPPTTAAHILRWGTFKFTSDENANLAISINNINNGFICIPIEKSSEEISNKYHQSILTLKRSDYSSSDEAAPWQSVLLLLAKNLKN